MAGQLQRCVMRLFATNWVLAEPEKVLRNVSDQTGLTFSLETRTVEILMIEAGDQ